MANSHLRIGHLGTTHFLPNHFLIATIVTEAATESFTLSDTVVNTVTFPESLLESTTLPDAFVNTFTGIDELDESFTLSEEVSSEVTRATTKQVDLIYTWRDHGTAATNPTKLSSWRKQSRCRTTPKHLRGE